MQPKGRVSDFVTSYSFRSAFILDFFVRFYGILFGRLVLGNFVRQDGSWSVSQLAPAALTHWAQTRQQYSTFSVAIFIPTTNPRGPI